MASLKPLKPCSAQVMLELCQSPVRYGTTMKMTSGIISPAPVTYEIQTAGRMPKRFSSQTMTMQPMAMKCDRPRCTTPSNTDQVAPGNHLAWMRSPMILPKIDRTTDQPIQYPNAPMGPTSENRPRQPSCAYSEIPPGLSGNIEALSE